MKTKDGLPVYEVNGEELAAASSRQTVLLSAQIRQLVGSVAMNSPEVQQRLSGYLDGKGMAPEQQWVLVIDEAHLEPQ